MCGREPTATNEEKTLGIERSTELSAIVNQVTACSLLFFVDLGAVFSSLQSQSLSYKTGILKCSFLL